MWTYWVTVNLMFAGYFVGQDDYATAFFFLGSAGVCALMRIAHAIDEAAEKRAR